MVRGVSAFLAEHLDPEEADATRTIPPRVVEGLRELGVMRMKVPQEYGGLGFSQVNYNRVLMAIASYCGSTAVLVSAHQSIGAPQPLKLFGTEQQKRTYLPRIAAGEISAFALTEPDVGSDPARMTTRADLSEDGSHYVLDGVKLWTTNGPIAQIAVVMAQTAPKVVRGRERRQITAFIVDMDSPGIEVEHRCDFLGLRAIQNGLIRFRDVRVPAENVLWGEGLGLKLALRTLNTGRLTLPAATTGVVKQCLAIAREWGGRREQWGLAVGRHEVGATRTATIAATALAMEAVTWLTSHWADQGRDIRIEAAMAKLFCSEACWSIVDSTLQMRGGRGYERASSLRARGETAYPLERMLRDCRINTIIEGTSDIMRLFLAREALDGHLTRATDLLRPGASIGGRLRATVRAGGHYAWWYPCQHLGRLNRGGHRSLGSLAPHARYARRASHRLAAALFHAMARHQQQLERRQVLLGHLMDVGTELFVMSATCAYAQELACNGEGVGRAPWLADLYCRQARRRIERSFDSLRCPEQRATNRLGEEVLEGRFRWLEGGIIRDGLAQPSRDSV
jgi:alkylation response protein AidB-like acyl-CoA dehydrogenase